MGQGGGGEGVIWAPTCPLLLPEPSSMQYQAVCWAGVAALGKTRQGQLRQGQTKHWQGSD